MRGRSVSKGEKKGCPRGISKTGAGALKAPWEPGEEKRVKP